LIIAENISKSFYEADERSHLIFSHMNVRIDTGSFTIIFGASGSGKSTFLNLVSGIDTVDTGTLIVGDVDLSQSNENARTLFRRKNIGLIFQSYNLIPTLTVEENILLPLELNGMNTAENAEFVKTMLKTVGLINRLKDFPKTLSGGEQQRVALARAFVSQPRLIFADEPTGSLDAANGEKISNLLFELQARHRTTIVLVTHAPELAERCQQVLRLAAGAAV